MRPAIADESIRRYEMAIFGIGSARSLDAMWLSSMVATTS
jgi:hypothetical protein